MNDLRLALRNAVDSPPADVFDIDVIVDQGSRRVRRRRIMVAGVAAAVAVLAAASISVAPSLVNHASQPATHWKSLQDDGSVPSDGIGVWVDSLPSGPVAQAAWVEGDVLHVGSKTVPITGPAVSASSGMVVRARTRNGWLVMLSTPPQGRLGVVHPDGRFVEFQKYPKAGPLLVSPDGTQALAGADGGGDLIDTTTGRIIGHEPHEMLGFFWGSDGIYGAIFHGPEVLWKPGIGVTRSPFDMSQCDWDGAWMSASLRAGYPGCTSPHLKTISPDGKTALAGNHVVDLTTGGTITFAPTDPFVFGSDGPSSDGDRGYAVVWEDNEHVLLALATPTIPAAVAYTNRQPEMSTSVIVRCNVDTGSCERASDPIHASGIGLAPLH